MEEPLLQNNQYNNKILAYLWIFLTVNYIFCGAFKLMYSRDFQQILEGSIGGLELTLSLLKSNMQI
ncbi:DUF6326 family protein [Aequorivita antarctica]|uniref:DUF6326 family protein n=1 Tax=Aequorivita antarctica TaxID=153266 RepID=UPI000DBBBAD5|nr:hypothetical protein AEQU3_02998 [Aequorivita antarctica]